MKWKYEEQSALHQNNRVHREAQHIGTSAWAGNIIISYHIIKWIMVSLEINTITSESIWTCSQVFLQKWNSVRQIVHKPLNIAVCETSREINEGVGCLHTILQQHMDCVCSCFMNVTHSYGFPPQSSLWFSNKMAFQSKANRLFSSWSQFWICPRGGDGDKGVPVWWWEGWGWGWSRENL